MNTLLYELSLRRNTTVSLETYPLYSFDMIIATCTALRRIGSWLDKEVVIADPWHT